MFQMIRWVSVERLMARWGLEESELIQIIRDHNLPVYCHDCSTDEYLQATPKELELIIRHQTLRFDTVPGKIEFVFCIEDIEALESKEKKQLLKGASRTQAATQANQHKYYKNLASAKEWTAIYLEENDGPVRKSDLLIFLHTQKKFSKRMVDRVFIDEVPKDRKLQ